MSHSETPESAPQDEQPQPTTLVLGLGNLVMSDDGIGVHIVRRLEEEYRFDAAVACMDGGTLGLDILPYLEGVERLLLIDAIDAGQQPGVCVRIDGDELPVALACKTSPHQIGVKDLLATAELLGHVPKHLTLIGVQPASLEMGIELTPEVEKSIGPATALALAELRRWGHEAWGR